MIDEVKRLNIKFYELYGDYHENRELIPAKQRDYITARLFDLYKEEYLRLYRRCEVENKQEEFRTKSRRALCIPRPWKWYTFWRRANKAARLLDKEIEKEAERFFAECAERIEKKTPAKNACPPPQIPENGDSKAAISADRPDASPRKRGNDFSGKQGSTNGASDRSEEVAPPAPADKEKKK